MKVNLLRTSSVLPVVAYATLLVAVVSAQISTASLTGLVTDPAGAAAGGSTVIARNNSTNVEQRVTTNSSGYYTFASLPIGTYEVSVEAAGFKRAIRDNVILDVGQKGRVDFALELGTVAESVVVKAGAPLLNTQEAAPGAVIENRLVAGLPLSARNWDDLLLLVAGVQGDRYTEQSGGTATGRTGGVDVHGVRSLQNDFILDGVDNNSISENVQELTSQIVRPSVDAIQEFKVISDPYSAEFGRSPGAAINVTTRSGSNAFHGGVYEFGRNRVFDANNFLANRTHQPKPQEIQNQFGGQIGGPILKNKLFFFANYEGTRIRAGVTRLTNVPLANERIGDFSAASAAAAHTTYAPIIDPLTGQPFANNRIPSQRIDPIAAEIMGLVPGPNTTPGSGPLNASNFVRTPNIQDSTDSVTGRVDYQADANDRLFVRYSYSNRFRFVPGFFGGVVDGTSTSAWGRLSMGAQGVSIGWNRVLSPPFVNDLRIGWGRNASLGRQDPFGQNTLASLGIKGIPDNSVISGGLPGINISSGGGVNSPGAPAHLGSPDFLPKWQFTNQYEWADTLNYIIGKHSLKTGIDFHGPLRNVFVDVPAQRGSASFTGQFTGNPIADFLLGYVGSAQESVFDQVDQRLWMLSAFVQDDWKVAPRLTLNIGLRYDFSTWPHEGANRMANFEPATSQLVFARDGSLASRSLVETNNTNFAPRIGIAYQVTTGTVVRAGYGRFYQLFDRVGSEDQLALNPPFLINVAPSTSSHTTPLFLLKDGFPASYRDAANIDLTKIRLRAQNPDNVMPSVDQWNLGVQREVKGQILLTIDYVGTKGTHLSVLRNLNQPLFGTNIVPYPKFGVIEYKENLGNSSYNGLDATLEKRFSQGLSFRAAYTYSRSIDEAMEHLFNGGSNSFLQNSRDLRQQRGLSDFDYRHRIVIGSIYALPFGSGGRYMQNGVASHVLGGWTVSGIFTRRSGRPFTVFAGSNNPFVGPLANALPDRINDGNIDPSGRSVDHWFDTTAFVVPKPARPGDSGRNILIGPGLTNMDFSLARSFRFGEERRLDFRWEVFNLSNTPQFGLPGADASSPATFGKINSLAGDPRVMQFALKLSF